MARHIRCWWSRASTDFCIGVCVKCLIFLCRPYVVSASFVVAWAASFSPESGQTSHPHTHTIRVRHGPPTLCCFLQTTTNHGRLMPAKHPRASDVRPVSGQVCTALRHREQPPPASSINRSSTSTWILHALKFSMDKMRLDVGMLADTAVRSG